MNYSTLREAYSIDSFEKKPKNKKKNKQEIEETFGEYPRTERIEKPEKLSELIDDKSDDSVNNEVVSSIEPYYDDELEKYLDVKDFASSGPYVPDDNISKSKINVQYPIHDSVSVTGATNIRDVKEEIKESVPLQDFNKKDVFYKNLVNIGLFALVGILIIFLCDQITEIAISIGMKKTVQILEPYLQEAILK